MLYKFERDAVKGVAMIEAIIASLILAIGIVGLTSLMLTAVKAYQNNSFKTSAIIYASDLANKIRLNPAGTYTQENFKTIPATVTLTGEYCESVCASSVIATQDINHFEKYLSDTMPQGSQYKIEASGDEYEITIQWLNVSYDGGVAEDTLNTKYKSFTLVVNTAGENV